MALSRASVQQDEITITVKRLPERMFRIRFRDKSFRPTSRWARPRKQLTKPGGHGLKAGGAESISSQNKVGLGVEVDMPGV